MTAYEKHLARMRERYAASAELREKKSLYQKQRRANPEIAERISDSAKRRYASDPSYRYRLDQQRKARLSDPAGLDCFRKYQRDYWRARYNDDPDFRERRQKRKINRRRTLLAELSTAQRGRCAYCREILGDDTHIDHIQPVSRGGSGEKRNFQLTCSGCNLAKNARDPIEFAQSLGMLL